MKPAVFILLFCIFSIIASAQSSVKVIWDSSLPIKNTGVQVDSFKITKPETAYDLALNLSYLHQVSEGLEGKFLVLPATFIDNKPAGPDQLKQLPIINVKDYTFKVGLTPLALFGSFGQYGYLDIKTGDGRNQNPVINPKEIED